MSGDACPSCGVAGSADQRYCGACGATLALPCGSCGAENPPGFKFCGSCGSPLGTASPRVPAVREERRWATVVFGDLSGFTKLSEHMDPEDVHDLVDGCMAKLSEVVERFEGRVERVTGDEIMVVFGAPLTREDDAERAVRTALEMQHCAAERAVEFGGLPLRVGVNTGEMMFAPVGTGDARQYTVMGDAVNTAARLQTAAPVGGVLVGEQTYEATKHVIDYEPVEPVAAKGKSEPVTAYLALRPLAEPATRPISEVPLLGREREVELLHQIWRRVNEDRQAHLVSVIGPPGIGKSKLVREFAARLEGGRALWGRSLPYAERAGGAFGQIVRQVADAYVTDDTELTRRKLATAVASLSGGDPELVDHLATIVGVGAGHEIERTELFAAARRFVEALAASEGTVLVFEDAHWADESLLELIQWLLPRVQDAPLLIVTLARPELLDAQPAWGGGLVSYTAIPIGPLPEDCVRQLAHRLRPGLDDTMLERIRDAAGGNPLFAEELAAWLADMTQPTGALPSTVTSIVAARLDSLPPGLRTVILDASVVGGHFWRGALEAIEGEVTEALDELAARDLIRRQATSRVPGDQEYAFRHQLIRDVAYSILPKAVRRERHEAVARFIEQRVGKSAPVIAGVLAYHWGEAGDADRSADYLVQAADLASQSWEQDHAVELLKQARGLIRPDDTVRKREVNLKLAVARTRRQHKLEVQARRELPQRD